MTLRMGEVAAMHSEVLSVLDTHLAELQALRRDLVAARPIGPGGRWQITADAAASARRCARRLGILLAGRTVRRISGPGFLVRRAQVRHRSSRWLITAVPPTRAPR
ncbi:hypothetical protein AB0J80_22315 [Actinoplanes sp. NPDC049548]|uniref:hypothetical protein n=1 Tax=Actinoplanes sp. NPDC049548 TaxID=3155152 RepID=UPI003445583B